MNNKAEATQMQPQTQRGLTPPLRFPEFRDAPAWEEKRLGDVAVFYKGKGLPKSAITPNGKNECIHYGELFTEYSEVIETVKSRTNLTSDGCFLSLANDVLMPTSDVTPNGLAKASCIKSNGVMLGGDILVIRTNKSLTIGQFLSRYIRYLEHKVLQLVSGTTVFHLYSSAIEKLTLSFPSLPEQQKIADCLTSLDALIAAHTQKHAALRAYKKGLLQHLFPAEGATLPPLRFPEFRDAPAWKEDDLSKLSSCGLSNGVFNDPKKVGSGYKLVNVLDMYIDTAINEDNLSLVELSRDEFLKNKVENGDIFFTRSSLVKSGIAYSNIYLGHSNDVTFDGHLIRFTAILIMTFHLNPPAIHGIVEQ